MFDVWRELTKRISEINTHLLPISTMSQESDLSGPDSGRSRSDRSPWLSTGIRDLSFEVLGGLACPPRLKQCVRCPCQRPLHGANPSLPRHGSSSLEAAYSGRARLTNDKSISKAGVFEINVQRTTNIHHWLVQLRKEMKRVFNGFYSSLYVPYSKEQTSCCWLLLREWTVFGHLFAPHSIKDNRTSNINQFC